jgi:cytochrome P450
VTDPQEPAEPPFAPVVHAGFPSFLRLAPRYLRNPIDFFDAVHARYGPSVLFDRLDRRLRPTPPFIVTRDPALARLVLNDRRWRSSALTLQGPRRSAQRRLRGSLFRMRGGRHHAHRTLVGPMLQKKAVEGYHGVMIQAVEGVIGAWKAGETRDLAPDLKTLARMVASLALFGHRDAAESAQIGEMAADWAHDSWRLLPNLLPFDRPGLPYRRMLAKADELERVILGVIARKRREGLPDDDLLTRLIRANAEEGRLTDAELVSHANVLFLAAHETTAYALDWTLYLIAQHPGVAERVCAEIDDVVGSGLPEASDLERLGLLDRVIRESLRLVPIVPCGARIAGSPVELPGLSLPKRARVLIPYHHMQRDPDVYPEPDRFDPDRWIDFEPPPYSYLPFSAGPHICIGITFAQHTMRLALTTMLQRFHYAIEPGARIDRRVSFTVSPRRGLPVRILPTDAPFERVPVRGDVLRMVDHEAHPVR